MPLLSAHNLITNSIGGNDGLRANRYSTTDEGMPIMETADDFADWRETLSKVEGLLCGRERRVSVAELVKLLDLDDLTGANRIEALTQVKRIMLSERWTAKVTKIGGVSVRGYVRLDPNAPAPAEPVAVINKPVLTPSDEMGPDALPRKLEKVSGMALEQAETILGLPIDENTSGNVWRAKTSIVGAVLATQSKVDENILRARRGGDDVLRRLDKLIRAAKRTIPKEPKKIVEAGPAPQGA
jgi:hypothetical protein